MMCKMSTITGELETDDDDDEGGCVDSVVLHKLYITKKIKTVTICLLCFHPLTCL
jgi:hypothetical protein